MIVKNIHDPRGVPAKCEVCTRVMSSFAIMLLSIYALFGSVVLGGEAQAAGRLRIGYFPNLTHAPALLAEGDQIYQKYLPDVRIEKLQPNAGPALIEAIFAGQLDIGYIGPNPAVNSYVKSAVGSERLLEVYVDCPLPVCEARDPKGLVPEGPGGTNC